MKAASLSRPTTPSVLATTVAVRFRAGWMAAISPSWSPAPPADAYAAPQAVAGDIHLSPQRGWAAFEESCAELGIDPATDALGACAGDLDASLLELHLTAAE